MIVIALVAGMAGCNGDGNGDGVEYDLTMAENPAGSGTATDLTNASPYAANTTVSIKAVAAAGYQFVNWTAPAGTFADVNVAETSFTMPPRDVTVTANFVAVIEYDLTMAVAPADSGTATDETNASPYAAGTGVNIKAVAAAGYQFVKWTAPASTFANPNAATTTFTMPAQDVTVTANFAFVAEPGPLDHFKCYLADGVEPIDEVVYLEDQFGAVNATVGLASGFGNPVMKVHDEVLTPISNPDHHLTVYDIEYAEEPRTWFVEVDNQFGTQQLTVSGPYALCVPTQKVEPGGHQPPVGLDHFLLYEVTDGPYMEVAVGLNDQFVGYYEEVGVYEPFLFANPVRKTHGEEVTEIVNPEAHLVFYGIVGGDFETMVQVDNQFGEQAFNVYTLFGNGALAVPSEKLSFAPAVYDLTMAVAPPGSGTATDLTDESPYAQDTEVSIKAVAAAGYQFVSWTAPAGTFANPNATTTTFTMPAQAVTVTANFVFVAEPGPLDHFKCYWADDVSGLPIGEVVYLEDQFGAVNATVEWAWGFGNPAEKLHDEVLTPILNWDHHLTFYNLSHTEEPQTWLVEVDNQFGTQQLTVSGPPVALAVPTQKEGHDPPVGLDHFLLYLVIAGPSVEVVVGLNDQFGDEEVWVYEPAFFANPVQKTHGGDVTEIENPEAHLVFYAISSNPEFFPSVVVNNQFGAEQFLNVYDPGFLAVPSVKLFADPID